MYYPPNIVNQELKESAFMKSNLSAMGLIIAMYMLHGSALGQGSIIVTTPLIISNVTINTKWSPEWSSNKVDQLSGSAIGTGLNVNYSFEPGFDKHLKVNFGLGYFNQRFNVQRFFNHSSMIHGYILYATSHYSYNCWQGVIGLSYRLNIGRRFYLIGNVTYNKLQSFRQTYAPTRSVSNIQTDIHHNQINFGSMLLPGIGLNRQLSERVSVGINLFVPLQMKWRNDTTFKDDPSTFTHPNSSFGSSVSVTYRLKKKRKFL